MIVRELITKLGFKVEDQNLKRFMGSVKSLRNTLLGVAGLATAAAGSLFAMAKSAGDAASEAADTASVLGTSTEALQELRYAADAAGVGTERFDRGLQKLAMAAGKATHGNREAALTFAALGVELRDATGQVRSSDAILMDFADGIARMPDGVDKLNLAVKILGDRSGPAMLKVLNQGSAGIKAFRQEARDLGLVLGDDVARQGLTLTLSLQRLRGLLRGLALTAGAELLPTINELLGDFTGWVRANQAILRENIPRYARGITKALRTLASWVRKLAVGFDWLARQLGGIENLLTMVGIALGGLVVAKIVYDIINVAKAFGVLIGAMRAAGTEGLVSWAKILLPIAGIVAGITAVIFILEDLVAWSQGRKSVFGELFPDLSFEEIKEKIAWVMIALGALIGLVAAASGGWVIALVAAVVALPAVFAVMYDDIVDWVSKAFLWVEDHLRAFATWVATWAITLWDPVSKALDGVAETLLTTFEVAVDKIAKLMDRVEGYADTAKDVLSKVPGFNSGVNMVQSWFGGGTAGAESDARAGANQALSTSVGTVEVNVQGSTNMSPQELSRATRDGIAEALEAHLRGASAAFDGGGY